MYTIRWEHDSGTRQYRDLIRIVERRALQMADDEPRPAASGKLCRQVAKWLGTRWATLRRALPHPGTMPAHSG